MLLKITLLQTSPVWEDSQRNLSDAQRLIATAKGQLVVLPEMFATGFTMTPDKCYLSPKVARKWFCDTALSSGKAVCGSVAVKELGKFYNRMYFATPDGNAVQYDKRHLFRMGGEESTYTRGTERITVEYKGFRILLAICYDLRFPVWLRNRGDYDLIINSASWAKARQPVWQTLLRARAIENQCYVVGVNRAGSDPEALYGGSSAVIDFYGEPIFEDKSAQPCSFTTELSLDSLEAFRQKFPVYLDADEFELK